MVNAVCLLMVVFGSNKEVLSKNKGFIQPPGGKI